MQKNIKSIFVFLVLNTLLASQLLVSCNPKEAIDTNKFDRKVMLENYANKLIKPAFADLKTQTDLLQTATQSFVAEPNAANLTRIQLAWSAAYSDFQYVNSYNLGAAAEQGTRKRLVEEIGTFPVSSSKIETTITQNNANFNDFNRDARGFLTVEYLIFDINKDNNRIINSFITQTGFANRKIFLTNAVSDLKTRIDQVNNGWNDAFITEFVANNGTDAGSSTSMFYNEFVRSFEALKNFKLGVPLGKRAGQTKTEAQTLEAYHSAKTLEMMKLHFIGLENIWYGKSKTAAQGLGFKAYLESVEGGNALVASTEAQILLINNAFKAIPTDKTVAFQIQNSPVLLENLHQEIQKNTRFFKSDMSSLLGIAITFISGDGD